MRRTLVAIPDFRLVFRLPIPNLRFWTCVLICVLRLSIRVFIDLIIDS